MKPICLLLGLLVTPFADAAASGGAQVPAAFKFENTPENLQTFLELFHKTIHIDKSPKEAAVLFRSLIPDQDRLKRALRDGVPPEAIERILSVFAKVSTMKDEDFITIVKPEQSIVRVRGATTEQIAAYREGTVAGDEFPGGAQQVAQQWLRPGVTFYQVAFLAPGESRGMTYHLFFWDGRRWAMVGPAWRAGR
jgi:hypothetical protein